MLRSTKYLSLVLVTLVACADTPDPNSSKPGGGKADGDLTTLTFGADWRESADGDVTAGLPIRIEYDLDRLTACRGSTNGSDVWAITGFAQFDDAAPQAFEVTRIVNGRTVAAPIELDIPARAERAQFWFTNTNRWGCNAYDSNDGANYAFDIAQRAGVSYAAFEASGANDLPARIEAGDQLVVHYEPERLAECAGSTAGMAAWSVTLFYQVDGGAKKQLLVTRASGPDLLPSDPEITVPRGHDLAMWFEAVNRWGCHAYDSALGANYHIAID
jgi:uncharacterized protein YraI